MCFADVDSSSEESGSDSDAGGSGSDSDSGSLPGADEEDDKEIDLSEWGAGAMAVNPDEDIPLMDESRRLAVVDLDWEHVAAVDVLAALR